MSEYFLMNKNSKLLRFALEVDRFAQYYPIELERYVNDALFPTGFMSIQSWLDRRNYAKHKYHLRKWLSLWQMDTLKGFLDITHALGLNDTLWVQRVDENLSWKQVSLYTNAFDDVVAHTAFSKGLQGLQLSSTSPEFTSEGSFEKCWVRDKAGNIQLYKKGSSGFANAGLEPYSEFYSSQLSALLCRSALHYDLQCFKGALVSSCAMFTDEDNGFIPIYKYFDSSKSYSLADVLDFMEQLGFADDFKDMIVLDAAILNPDRHFGNFGFIIDNDTFKVKRFAPVFDHNMALAARAMDNSLDEDIDYLKSCGHKIGADFVQAAKFMLTHRNKNILRQLLNFEFTTHSLYNLPPERLDFLNNLVHNQIRSILA